MVENTTIFVKYTLFHYCFIIVFHKIRSWKRHFSNDPSLSICIPSSTFRNLELVLPKVSYLIRGLKSEKLSWFDYNFLQCDVFGKKLWIFPEKNYLTCYAYGSHRSCISKWPKLASVSAVTFWIDQKRTFLNSSNPNFLPKSEISYCVLLVRKHFPSTVGLYGHVRKAVILPDCNFTLATWLQEHLEMQMFNIRQLQQHMYIHAS